MYNRLSIPDEDVDCICYIVVVLLELIMHGCHVYTCRRCVASVAYSREEVGGDSIDEKFAASTGRQKKLESLSASRGGGFAP